MTDPSPGHEIRQRTADAAIQFERFAVPHLLGPWAVDIVEAVSPGGTDRVLDVACGTGVVARLAARSVGAAGRVVGLDLDPEMLAVARTVPQPGGPPIEWREGDATALPFAGGSFDVVTCQQGLQFFQDRAAALREMRRVLGRDGRLAVAVWQGIEHNPYFHAMTEAVGTHLGAEASARMRISFALGGRHDVESLMLEAGFVSITIRSIRKTLRLPPLEESVPRHLAATSLSAAAAALSDGGRKALIAEVRTALRSFEALDGVHLPFGIHLASAIEGGFRDAFPVRD